jgi:hypothetical protein
MTSAVDDPHYWYARAEESRVLAEQMVDPEARRIMFGIAKSYDLIAQRTGERLRGEAVSAASTAQPGWHKS